MKPNRLGIEMLTLIGMPPVEHVRLAAELGCVSISTGLTGLPASMIEGGALYLPPIGRRSKATSAPMIALAPAIISASSRW